jgi:hypothetical protein
MQGKRQPCQEEKHDISPPPESAASFDDVPLGRAQVAMLQRLLTAAKCDDVVKKPPRQESAAAESKVTAAMMRELVPSRDKLITLCDVLDLQLAELKSLQQSGALRAFTSAELRGLVKALFEHSEAREQVCVCVSSYLLVTEDAKINNHAKLNPSIHHASFVHPSFDHPSFDHRSVRITYTFRLLVSI